MTFGDIKHINIESIGVYPKDVEYLDRALLDENGRLKLLTNYDYRCFPHVHLRVWASLHSRYGFPTTELIAWLKERIAKRTALEIAAGNGDLGHRLDIPMTDSYQQVDDRETMLYLAAMGVTPTNPPPDVKKEDGENAVRRRKPRVVIACYATEKWDKREPNKPGNYKGIRYGYVIERCETFILIGNKSVHGQSSALALPHEEFYFPWIVTRSKQQSDNRIWVWNNSAK